MQSGSLSKSISSIALPLVILGCVGAIATLQVPQLHQLKTKSSTASVESLQREIDLQKTQLAVLKQLPTFGYDNLVGNIAFLSFLQYFGDAEARQKTDYQLSPEFFEVTLNRDPYFIPAYTFASTSSALYAGLPERSVALMQNGLTSLKPNVPPFSYYAWRQLGIDQLLFIGDTKGAIQSLTTAADWAEMSGQANSDVTVTLSRQTVAFLAKNPDSKTARVATWLMVLSNAPDEPTQKIVVQRLAELGVNMVKDEKGMYSIQPNRPANQSNRPAQ